MQVSTLVRRNLAYYWRTNLAVVAGVATAVAVLAGALLVGESVRASLRELFLQRLGRTDYVLSAGNFFREQLAADMESRPGFAGRFAGVCPLLHLPGLVLHERSGRRASGVAVYGVDERFWRFHGHPEAGRAPRERETLLSESLALELGANPGDAVVLRIEKPSDMPKESLHGRKDDAGRAIRFSAREALPASALGEFATRPQQGAVRAVFVPLRRLQKELGQEGRANTVLISEKPAASEDSITGAGLLRSLLRKSVLPEDLGLRLRWLEERRALVVESAGGILSDALAGRAADTAANLGLRALPVFTYLANTIRSGQKEIPYSLVTATDLERLLGRALPACPEPPERCSPIVLNDWAARELGARPGDRVSLDYYLWQPGGRLTTHSAEFRLVSVAPLEGAAADRDLAPQYPGITDSKNLGDWDPPFPIDLKRIRPRDEQYWHRHRTTPKAFIPLEKGQQLWKSRFGKLTSLRIIAETDLDLRAKALSYPKALQAALDPVEMGFSVYPVRASGLEASRGATDFGEYFVYFSFFLMVSAVLLAGLFFKLGVEQRLQEVGTLRALGFPPARIRTVFLSEAVVLATLGSVLGLAGALAYGGLIMLGLRTWWVEAVGTRSLELHVRAAALAAGGLGGVVTALLAIAWTLRGLRAITPRSLLAGAQESVGARRSKIRAVLAAGAAAALLSLLLVFGASRGGISQVAGFFGAGTASLAAFLCYLWIRLAGSRQKLLEGTGVGAVSRLGFRNAGYRPSQSILCVALIASATFVLVAVDAFRRDDRRASSDRKSGSGGFPLLAESLLPLYHDPNSESGRESLNLPALPDVAFVPFRLRPGEDTSCLNLYRPASPRIMAPPAEFLRRARFAFQSSLAGTPEEKRNPWLLLDREPAGGAVPAIVDADSMTYVLHLKLGDEFVLNSESDRPVRLRLVAALADSVFQRELLISESNFLRLFPTQEGYRFFLLEVPAEKAGQVTGLLEEALSDYGFDIVPTAELLAGFHRVENTYLSTFQTLGGLGLVLGTVGLAAVLLRNVLARRRELALLRAVGYRPRHLAALVLAENSLLLLLGLVAGAASALLAIAPAFLARGGHLPTASLGLLLVAVLVTGLAASVLATRAALRSPLLPALRSE